MVPLSKIGAINFGLSHLQHRFQTHGMCSIRTGLGSGLGMKAVCQNVPRLLKV